MARWPGTEVPTNKAGWRPGAGVRALRMRANGVLGLADRRGFVTEVRPTHARVYFGEERGSTWLASEAIGQADDLPADLERLRRVHAALRGERLEIEDGEVVVFTPGFPLEAGDAVRELLGDDVRGINLEAFGVHEVAVKLVLRELPA